MSQTRNKIHLLLHSIIFMYRYIYYDYMYIFQIKHTRPTGDFEVMIKYI